MWGTERSSGLKPSETTGMRRVAAVCKSRLCGAVDRRQKAAARCCRATRTKATTCEIPRWLLFGLLVLSLLTACRSVPAAGGADARETVFEPETTLRFVETNGIRMRIAERGQGPLVLLLHGWPEL